MEKKGQTYFTFPVSLLRGAFDVMKDVCNNAMNYAIYVKYVEVKDINEVQRFFGITFNEKESLKNGKVLFDRHGQNVSMVSVARDILFSIYQKDKRTDFEVATFLAYCGLKSILGTNAYKKTNNEHLIARMAGYSTYSEYVEVSAEFVYFENFSTPQKIRYLLTEKIIRRELVLNWGLKYYSQNTKGFYFGFDIDLESLIYTAEKARKSNRLKAQKAKEVEAIRAAKNRLIRYG